MKDLNNIIKNIYTKYYTLIIENTSFSQMHKENINRFLEIVQIVASDHKSTELEINEKKF